jgi:hypothetical protein
LGAFYGVLDVRNFACCVPLNGNDAAFGAGTGSNQHLVFLDYVCLNCEKHGFAQMRLGRPLGAGNAQGGSMVGEGKRKVGADRAVLGGKVAKTEVQKDKEGGTHDWSNVLNCQ